MKRSKKVIISLVATSGIGFLSYKLLAGGETSDLKGKDSGKPDLSDKGKEFNRILKLNHQDWVDFIKKKKDKGEWGQDANVQNDAFYEAFKQWKNGKGRMATQGYSVPKNWGWKDLKRYYNKHAKNVNPYPDKGEDFNRTLKLWYKGWVDLIKKKKDKGEWGQDDMNVENGASQDPINVQNDAFYEAFKQWTKGKGRMADQGYSVPKIWKWIDLKRYYNKHAKNVNPYPNKNKKLNKKFIYLIETQRQIWYNKHGYEFAKKKNRNPGVGRDGLYYEVGRRLISGDVDKMQAYNEPYLKGGINIPDYWSSWEDLRNYVKENINYDELWKEVKSDIVKELKNKYKKDVESYMKKVNNSTNLYNTILFEIIAKDNYKKAGTQFPIEANGITNPIGELRIEFDKNYDLNTGQKVYIKSDKYDFAKQIDTIRDKQIAFDIDPESSLNKGEDSGKILVSNEPISQ